MTSFPVRTPERECLVDVTPQVARLVSDAGVAEGLCVVCVPHTTAGVTLNESADPDVARDLLAFLAGAVPHRGPYRHVEGNSDAHIKTSLLGSSVTVPVSGGRLVLGTWQGLFLAEFDGPRQRTVHVVVARG
ncbi:MAG: YjbQ family protein [Deltaproteobacteria bacterium]|nr:YjbQ family protein [Deltaproteobacteria bacterium]